MNNPPNTPEFWNERYKNEKYVYGKAPNEFLKECIEKYQPSGSILLPAEGQGRNAIYAAKQGLDVVAFDMSEQGREDALKFADENNVSIEYVLGDIESQQFPEESFNAIALIYAHFHYESRRAWHHKLMKWLKPGGYLFLEAFSDQHEAYQAKNPSVGGPRDKAYLFPAQDIQEDFEALNLLHFTDSEVHLQEGNNHLGLGYVVRVVGQKERTKTNQ